jgi:hypothetical protein
MITLAKKSGAADWFKASVHLQQYGEMVNDTGEKLNEIRPDMTRRW